MLRRITVLLLCLAAAAPALAQQQPPRKSADEQVVVPDVPRRDVALPKFPSKDWEVGAFFGTYSAESFGAHPIAGLRAGYHFTEDVFMELAYGRTRVSDEAFRRVLPGGVFADEREALQYVNLSTGFNMLPGEVFLGSKRAKATAIYVIGGVGTTRLQEQRRQTLNFGLGLKLLLSDRWAVRVDMRDHVFSFDLLGKRESTQNLELTAGVGFHF